MEAPAIEPQGTDLEIMKKMEDEHLRLQRQVRMIQIDRQHRNMGVHPQFRRNDSLLRTLKKEYINFIKDLKIARSGAHKKNDKRMKADIKNALLLRVQTEMAAEGGTTLMKQLEELLQNEKKDMLILKQLETTKRGQIDQRRTLSEHRLISTENQLEAATLRFNVLQAENNKIREEIEHMLKDRLLFNKAWNKSLAALGKGKKFLTDLFESSTLAYDQRDEWVTKLRSIQEKGKIDQMVQVQEMRELKKLFDHEMKLYHFLSAKGIMRINKKEEKEQEQEKIREMQKISKEYDTHTAILSDICDYTQEEDPQMIIDAFNQLEQQNFSVYVLVTEYCAEIEGLTRSLAGVRQNVDDYRDRNEMKENQRQANLEAIRAAVDEKRTSNEALRDTLNERVQLMDRTMEKILEMFKYLECSLEPYENLLGDKQPSLMQFNLTMKLIVEKVQELIEVVYYYERNVQKLFQKGTGRLKRYVVNFMQPHELEPLPMNLMVLADTCPSCVEARWLSRVSEVPETPFSKQEALAALGELQADTAFVWSDRIHPLTDCRAPTSRVILARRYMHH